VMASSSEQARLIEVFELQNDQGPCLDAFRAGATVAVRDADEQRARWPSLSTKLDESGLGAAYAVPMRLREQTIGAVNFFSPAGAPLPEGDLATAKALADVATIAILQYRASVASVRLAEQLQVALGTRVMIEQAKGVLAERGGVEMDVAFGLLRGYARRNNALLADVAEAVVLGTLSTELALDRQDERRRD
jgi:GAF domain-containing protein